jgi:hypothetical protein
MVIKRDEVNSPEGGLRNGYFTEREGNRHTIKLALRKNSQRNGRSSKKIMISLEINKKHDLQLSP